MSHRPSVALSAILLTLACSGPNAPESKTPEAAEPVPSEPAATPSPSADDPASPVSTSNASTIETLFVRDQRATCEGEGTRECLQVRSSAGDEWRNLYAPIVGFEYEPGNSYELKVEVSKIAKPPADAPSLEYRLLEVVSKQKTGK